MVKLVRKIINLKTKSTSIRLCDQEWQALDEICEEEKIKRRELIEKIKKHKNEKLGLTAAIRLLTLLYYKYGIKRTNIENEKDINNILSEIS